MPKEKLILRIQFPPGLREGMSAKVLKFDSTLSVMDAIKVIVETMSLENPEEWLLLALEEGDTAYHRWLNRDCQFQVYGLENNSTVYLKRKFQILRVSYKGNTRTLLFNFLAPLKEWMPMVRKKFDVEGKDCMLFLSGSTRPLILEQSLSSQAIAPDAVLDLRGSGDPILQARVSKRQRLTIALGKAPLAYLDDASSSSTTSDSIEANTIPTAATVSTTRSTRSFSLWGRGSTSEKKTSGRNIITSSGGVRGKTDATKQIDMVNLHSAAKSIITRGDRVGFLTKANRKMKWEKRLFILYRAHLFYYKTKNDSKPAGVIPLMYFKQRTISDSRGKHYVWELYVTGGVGGAKRSNYLIRTESDSERSNWMQAIDNAITSNKSKMEGRKVARKPPQRPPSASAITGGSRRKGGGDDAITTQRGGGGGGGEIGYFGLPLDIVVGRDGGEVPYLVRAAISYIDEKAIKAEGIFRLSGSATGIEAYKTRFNAGEKVDLGQEADPHAVAGLLKLYLRELPEPILSYNHYQDFLDVMCVKDENVKLECFRTLISMLGKVNQATLKYLIAFLIRVNEHSDVNMMALHNLATVFAPNLLARKGASMFAMVEDTPIINAILHYIIQNYEVLFQYSHTLISDTKMLSGENERTPLTKVLYDYTPQSPDELLLKKGDVLAMVKKDMEGGWAKGVVLGGSTMETSPQFGRFPASYVTTITPEHANKKIEKIVFNKSCNQAKIALHTQSNTLHNLKTQVEIARARTSSLHLKEKLMTEELDHMKELLNPILSSNDALNTFTRLVIDQFIKMCVHHRDGVQQVTGIQDEFTTSVGMLLGAIPLDSRYTKLRDAIEAVKPVLKLEELARLALLEAKEDIVRDVKELHQLFALCLE